MEITKDSLEVIRSNQAKKYDQEEIKWGRSRRYTAQAWEGWHGDTQFRLGHVGLRLQWEVFRCFTAHGLLQGGVMDNTEPAKHMVP